MSTTVSTDLQTPYMEWEDFTRQLRWRQGEHLTLIGANGTGKTTLALLILGLRRFVIVAATKRKDEQLDKLKKRGFVEVKSWTELVYYWDSQRFLYRPRLKSLSDYSQAQGFRELLDGVFNTGNITFYADEVRYLTEQLGLKRDMQVLWLQGRALKITIVAATQRPAHIPIEAYSEATHLFIYRLTDRKDLQRITEISGGVDHALIKHEVTRLPRYQTLYINTRTGDLIRTMVPKSLATGR